jgi:hypothetical protein
MSAPVRSECPATIPQLEPPVDLYKELLLFTADNTNDMYFSQMRSGVKAAAPFPNRGSHVEHR